MVKIYVTNCQRQNWDVCEQKNIFGLKKAGKVFRSLSKGDIILMRMSGRPYGVKAIWSFDYAEANETNQSAWTDGERYRWILHCHPIVTLPQLFSENFKTTHIESTKMPGLFIQRIRPSIIKLEPNEAIAYLKNILGEFGYAMTQPFTYFGDSFLVEGFLKETLNSIQEGRELNLGNIGVEGDDSDFAIENYVKTGEGFAYGEANREVEQAAITKVTDVYEKEGWKVISVESQNVGYDLVCQKGAMTHCVEVKGLGGPIQNFTMTKREFEQVESNPEFVIFVVTEALSESKISGYSSNELIKNFKFEPIAYRVIKK